MPLVPLRTAVYLVVCAVPALAQPTLIRDEPPHVELSVGVAGMISPGPGTDIEREMRRLHLDFGDGRRAMPVTELPTLVPGGSVQTHIGVLPHATIGGYLGIVANQTSGMTEQRGLVLAHSTITTGALIVSFRPNPWLKIGAGPALHDRRFSFDDGRGKALDATEDARLGWVASGEAKFARHAWTADHPPAFGYAMVQYRSIAPLRTAAAAVPVLSSRGPAIDWPSSLLHFSHWILGFGVGVEF